MNENGWTVDLANEAIRKHAAEIAGDNACLEVGRAPEAFYEPANLEKLAAEGIAVRRAPIQ